MQVIRITVTEFIRFGGTVEYFFLHSHIPFNLIQFNSVYNLPGTNIKLFVKPGLVAPIIFMILLDKHE